ncbi:unnamed protein product [Rotaria socialis]|uniref:G-protein coupled receptors family 1 profile domain-containing protein n=2 Tax=Rotaria socialis TaxID=392032 RepID=A0A820X5P4_9BILA|nr:unnamed protein product [Rotaria socialis]CAF3423029.1 unnamed protein product [Rotaria socialis]CAF4281766.1 unnamed protein product [Rotaria socialis]CAF4529343.1 unnamed protein product [Rotaria socialis]
MIDAENVTSTSLNNSLNTVKLLSHTTLLEFFFRHVYLLLLVVIGCIGNGFVIIVFGQRALRTTIASMGSNMSVYPFLFYMAISDTIYLSILFCLWLSNYINILHRPVVCQLTLYLTYVCNFISAYYTVSFTAQRLFAVVKPFRVSHVLSWYRSRCLALFIICIACLIYSYLPFLIGIVNGQCFSLKHLRWINELMDIVDCFVVFLIPYISIIVMNAIILISLRRMKQNPREFLFRNHSQLNQIREITRRSASRKMTKLLLAVSTSYLIICAPYASIHTWRLLYGHKTVETKLIRLLEKYFHSIYQISFAINFYIYILFDSKFRRELKRLFMKLKINICHCFRHSSFYDNENSLNPNRSSNCEQFQLMDRTSPSTILTTSGFVFGFKYK